MELNRIYNEDCLEGMKRIPDESVDMILTDPPYGTIKGLDFKKVGSSGLGRTDWDNKVDLDKLFEEYFRILKPKGKALIFSQNQFTQELRNKDSTYLSYLYPLIWKKNNFANFLSVNKAPVQIFEDISVFDKIYGLMPKSRKYADMILEFIGKKPGEINKDLGHRKTEHFFRTKTLQFSNISESAYNDLIEKYGIHKADFFLEYAEWVEMYEKERNGTKAKVCFNIPEGRGHVSNIFEIPKESERFHPTQKPVRLLSELLEIYTEPQAVVMDSFMGSGTTAIACLNTNRNFIGFELDANYHAIALERIAQHERVVK